MHFDSVQAHSGQMLMPATHFSLGAATAGLLPEEGLLTYPKDSAYTRIVLQQLRPAGLSIRLATLGDLPGLLELEAFWKTDVLSASEATLRRFRYGRCDRAPTSRTPRPRGSTTRRRQRRKRGSVHKSLDLLASVDLAGLLSAQ